MLREVEDDKENNVFDQDLRPATPEPEPVGSSTPRHSTDLGEYIEDTGTLDINKEELFEADTMEVKEEQALGTHKTKLPEDQAGNKKKNTISLLSTIQRHARDVQFFGDIEDFQSIERLRRREQHLTDLTSLMTKLEVETGLKEGEWRKSVTKQRYVKSNLPLRKSQDNSRNWKILSNVISSSLIRITKLKSSTIAP